VSFLFFPVVSEFRERSRTHVFLGAAKSAGKKNLDETTRDADADARTENA
jgi:hypothetical protein